MRKKFTLLCILAILLQTSCTSIQPIQDNTLSKISCNLFYEYWDFTGYKTKNLKIINGVVCESNEKWERGFAEAIPVDPAEKLAQELGFKSYIDLQLAYGQLYHFENYPIGKVYIFFGNYNGTDDYTVMIWDDHGVHKIELPDTGYLFQDLQINENYLYLILSEYSGEMHSPEGNIFVYEIELNGFTPAKYTLPCKKDLLLYCSNFLVKNKKLYLVNNVNITHTTADSTLAIIDLLTNNTYLLEKKGLYAESLFSAENMVAVIYGKMVDGNPALPPYIEYYDEQLNITDSITLTVNDENYSLYFGDFLFYDSNMYLILSSVKSRDCLFVIHNMNTNERIYAVEIKSPVKGAIMQDATFFINENGEYFTLP